MPYNNRRPSGCPQEVYDAMDVFTDEELETLVSDYSWETGEFLGIGFLGPGGKFCTYADPTRAAAIAILDNQCRKELYGDPAGWVVINGLHSAIPDNIVEGAINILQSIVELPCS